MQGKKRIISVILMLLLLGCMSKFVLADTGWRVPLYTIDVTETEHEMRTWKLKRAIKGYGREFEAAFVAIAGFEAADPYVTFILKDGTKRGLPLAVFSNEDQELALALNEELMKAAEARRANVDLGEYISEPMANRNTSFSKYFRFIWGDTRGSGGRWFNEDFRKMNEEYYDLVFEFAVHELGFFPPYGDENVKRKIDVEVFGTGIGDGWAFGSHGIWIHPDAMLQGSTVIPHEFGHVLQFYSGGYRHSPFVGFFWETHANWVQHQFIPAVPSALEVYNSRVNHFLSSTRFNYGSWMFLQYMAEHPDLGPDFVNRAWTEVKRQGTNNPRRDHGLSLEDPFQTYMRLGVEDGIFEHPEKGFGDVIGGMAARNVTWDYVFQYVYQNAVSANRRNRIVLEEVPYKEGWYRPPYAIAPQTYGYNVVELAILDGAESITVEFEGEKANAGADWRATIVVESSDGSVRYSEMWNNGVRSIDLNENDVKAYLTVAATPFIYEPVDLRQGFQAMVRYPYLVKFTGAIPQNVPVDHLEFRFSGSRHPNGGGFVSNFARVDETAYVAENAQVLGMARVRGNARIEDNAIVKDSAKVLDNAIVSGYAVVSERATVSGDARVRDYAVVAGDVEVTGNARILEYANVRGGGVVSGNAVIKNLAEVNTGSRTGSNAFEITGGTIIGLNAEFHPWSGKVESGYFYDYVNSAGNGAKISEPYLYAHYDFSKPDGTILLDKAADNNAFIEGEPFFGKVDRRDVVTLNGENQFIALNKDLSDYREMTIEVAFKWHGGQANQPLFDFGTSVDNTIYLTPHDDQGRLVLNLIHDGKHEQVVSKKAVSIDKWNAVTICFDDHTVKMYLNNELVATEEVTILPEDLRVRSSSNYIGRNQDGSSFLNASIDYVKIYSVGVKP